MAQALRAKQDKIDKLQAELALARTNSHLLDGTGSNTIAVENGRHTITLPQSNISHSDMMSDVNRILESRAVVSIKHGDEIITISRGMSHDARGERISNLFSKIDNATNKLGQLRNGEEVIMANAGKVTMDSTSGLVVLKLDDATTDGTIRALQKLIADGITGVEVRSANGNFYTRVSDTHNLDAIRNRVSSLFESIGGQNRSTDNLAQRVASDGKVTLPAGDVIENSSGRLQLNVRQGATETEIRNAADEMMRIDLNRGIDIVDGTTVVSMTGNMGHEALRSRLAKVIGRTPVESRASRGWVDNEIRDNGFAMDNGFRINSSDGVDSYVLEIPRGASSHQVIAQAKTLIGSGGRVVRMRRSDGEVFRVREVGHIKERVEDLMGRPLGADSPAHRPRVPPATPATPADTVIPSVGKLKASAEGGAHYHGRSYKTLELDSNASGDDIYEYVSAYLEANQRGAIELTKDGAGFMVNEGTDVASRLKDMGYKVDSIDTLYNAPAIGKRLNLRDTDIRDVKTQVIERLTADLGKSLGWKARIASSGRSIVIMDKNGVQKANFYPRGARGHFGADTTGLTQGSGEGKRVYQALWDAIEGTGMVYKANSGLLEVNQVKMTINMLDYLAKRGGRTAPHVRMGNYQVGGRVTEGRSSFRQLSTVNAKSLMGRFITQMQGSIERITGSRLTADTTDTALNAMINKTGRANRVRLGSRSLKMMRRFMQSGDIKAFSLALSALVGMKEFNDMLESGEGL